MYKYKYNEYGNWIAKENSFRWVISPVRGGQREPDKHRAADVVWV